MVKLMQMCNSVEEYELLQYLYKDYEEDKHHYIAEMERCEEDSNNYQRNVEKEKLLKKQAAIEQIFD